MAARVYKAGQGPNAAEKWNLHRFTGKISQKGLILASGVVPACGCNARPAWAKIEDDSVMAWPVIELAEWEELRKCPDCGSLWLAVWPEEVEGGMILCRPAPASARRLREIDRASTLRAYCLSRLEDHFGELRERRISCRKMNCDRRRLAGTNYCLEHLIAERFGRHLAKLENTNPGFIKLKPDPKPDPL